jgi:phytoene/squalene synthetase
VVTLERIHEASALACRHDAGRAMAPAEETIALRMCSASASFRWSTRLLPAPRRKAMQGLYVFCRELDDISDSEASRTLKLTLLGDWRTEIALLYAGRPQHLVTRALRDAIKSFDLRCDDFLAVIDGTGVSRWPLASVVACSSLASCAISPRTRHGSAFTCHGNCCWHGIFATMPSYALAQPALPQLCNALAERASVHFADAERAIAAHPRPVLLVTTAILSSYRRLLKALLARGWTRLDEPVRIPAWHQAALFIGHGLVDR